MGTDQNPYQAYTDGSIFSDNPVSLVVALYQGALEATQQAERRVQCERYSGADQGDQQSHCYRHGIARFARLERGGEISQNLKQLYSYMQRQLFKAHMRQTPSLSRKFRSC